MQIEDCRLQIEDWQILSVSKILPHTSIQPVHAGIIRTVADQHRLTEVKLVSRGHYSAVYKKSRAPKRLACIRPIIAEGEFVSHSQAERVTASLVLYPLNVDFGDLTDCLGPSP